MLLPNLSFRSRLARAAATLINRAQNRPVLSIRTKVLRRFPRTKLRTKCSISCLSVSWRSLYIYTLFKSLFVFQNPWWQLQVAYGCLRSVQERVGSIGGLSGMLFICCSLQSAVNKIRTPTNGDAEVFYRTKQLCSGLKTGADGSIYATISSHHFCEPLR